MNETELKSLIISLLKNIAPDSEPAALLPDDDIRKKLDIDSFDYLRFITALCEAINKNIPEEDYGRITTLNKLLPYLQKLT